MKFDGKVKGGLAWAGLFVVLAVPTADLLFPAADANANLVTTSDTRPVVVAPATTATRPAILKVPTAPTVSTDPVETAGVASGSDPVDQFVNSGKPLPDYISDSNQVASTPQATQPAAVKLPGTPGSSPVQTASLSVDPVPVPLPRTARPAVQAVAAVPAAETPLILDETVVTQREATRRPVDPFPLSSAEDDEIVITGDQLEEWDSGSLADYLARKGLISEGGSGDTSANESDYVFNDGPSRPRRFRDDTEFFLF